MLADGAAGCRNRVFRQDVLVELLYISKQKRNEQAVYRLYKYDDFLSENK
jgi:hypothetical protein